MPLPDPVLLDPLPSRVAAAARVLQIHAAAVRGEWVEAYREGIASQLLSWEALHTGHWTTVDATWRTAYAVACFYLATAGVEAARQQSIAADDSAKRRILAEALKAALKHADMGLMLGDTTCRRPLLQLAERLEDALASYCEHAVEHSSPWTAHGAQPASAESNSIPQPVTLRALSGSGQLPRLRRPSLPFFYNQCMDPASPAVLLGVIDAWPAMSTRRWSLDYLLGIAGHRTVPVETGRHYLSDDFDEQLMSLGGFIRRCVAPGVGVGGVSAGGAGGGEDVTGGEARGKADTRARGGAGEEVGGGTGGEADGDGVSAEPGTKRAPRRVGGGCGDEAESCKRPRQDGLATAAASAGPQEPIWGASRTVAGSGCRADTAWSSAPGSEPGWSAHDGGTSQPVWGYLAQHQLFEQLPLLRRDITIPDYCSLTLEEEEDRCAVLQRKSRA